MSIYYFPQDLIQYGQWHIYVKSDNEINENKLLFKSIICVIYNSIFCIYLPIAFNFHFNFLFLDETRHIYYSNRNESCPKLY